MSKRSRKYRIARAFMITAAVFAASSLLLQAVFMVTHGRGAASYESVYGLPVQYTSVLIGFVVLVCAGMVAVIVRWQERRRRLEPEVHERGPRR